MLGIRYSKCVCPNILKACKIIEHGMLFHMPLYAEHIAHGSAEFIPVLATQSGLNFRHHSINPDTVFSI